ncbi:hypothetical protein FVE85_0092 [Porphyridium purpureum]|uniref:Uncharacterized protein n=1 Tax=Porphyridium purpureum TaxID=35688 RepID=A0A5J4Z0K2_PORPP|nr:hypothetical protein FVE85_0092 [Porphyridium purpureum]|eukprot:POR8335..scf208_2
MRLVRVRSVDVLVKCDHERQLRCGVSGNKVRKFAGLQRKLAEQEHGVKSLVSFGGVQSNAMLALASIAADANVAFEYYTRTLYDEPAGNLALALEHGMKLYELGKEAYADTFNSASAVATFCNSLERSDLFIFQGGACKLAEPGCLELAQEIHADVLAAQLDPANVDVAVCSGTGTLAFFLAQGLAAIGSAIRVLVIPVVGDESTTRAQWQELCTRESISPRDMNVHILVDRKRPFAKPRRALYGIWLELREHWGLPVDLVYGARAFEILFNVDGRFQQMPASTSDAPRQLVYYHCGGMEGDVTQLERYKSMGLDQ